MSVQFVITESAHLYGLDNMPVDTTQQIANATILGDLVSASQSWSGEIPPSDTNQTVTTQFAKGFSITTSVYVINDSSAVLTGLDYYKTGTNELLVHIGTSIAFNDSIPDVSNQVLYGGADSITGNSFNNKLMGLGGNDVINGGGGVDTAYYTGTRSGYQISGNASTATVSGIDGYDTLNNVERLHFSDKTVALDIDGNAGQAYRLYQAALNRTPDPVGLGAQIGGLDAGASLKAIAQNFMNSAEFKFKYGENLSDGAFVTQLYSNVLHRAPDQGGYDVQTHALATGGSRVDMLVNFSESAENYQTTLVGIKNGIEYVPGA